MDQKELAEEERRLAWRARMQREVAAEIASLEALAQMQRAHADQADDARQREWRARDENEVAEATADDLRKRREKAEAAEEGRRMEWRARKERELAEARKLAQAIDEQGVEQAERTALERAARAVRTQGGVQQEPTPRRREFMQKERDAPSSKELTGQVGNKVELMAQSSGAGFGGLPHSAAPSQGVCPGKMNGERPHFAPDSEGVLPDAAVMEEQLLAEARLLAETHILQREEEKSRMRGWRARKAAEVAAEEARLLAEKIAQAEAAWELRRQQWRDGKAKEAEARRHQVEAQTMQEAAREELRRQSHERAAEQAACTEARHMEKAREASEVKWRQAWRARRERAAAAQRGSAAQDYRRELDAEERAWRAVASQRGLIGQEAAEVALHASLLCRCDRPKDSWPPLRVATPAPNLTAARARTSLHSMFTIRCIIQLRCGIPLLVAPIPKATPSNVFPCRIVIACWRLALLPGGALLPR